MSFLNIIVEPTSDSNTKHGSYKRSARDWFLFLLAKELIDATGRPHIEQLATLLDAARSANNERRHPTYVATLTKRIQRWRKYLDAKVINGRMMFRMSTGNTSSQTEAGDDAVPF